MQKRPFSLSLFFELIYYIAPFCSNHNIHTVSCLNLHPCKRIPENRYVDFCSDMLRHPAIVYVFALNMTISLLYTISKTNIFHYFISWLTSLLFKHMNSHDLSRIVPTHIVINHCKHSNGFIYFFSIKVNIYIFTSELYFTFPCDKF